jgi:hypothetical protein
MSRKKLEKAIEEGLGSLETGIDYDEIKNYCEWLKSNSLK